MRGDTVEIYDLVLKHQTEMAYLIIDEDGEEYWIPKSQVVKIIFGEDIMIEGEPAKKISELEIPEWLAEDKGLSI